MKPLLANNTGSPLAAHVKPTQQRAIPVHPQTLLNGSPTPQFHEIESAIEQAINVGAPLYNQGNFEACYRIYREANHD